MFGAVGDGKTDDTNALQTAINTIPAGYTVDFGGPSKTYLISSRLNLQGNHTYSGTATLLMSKNAPQHTGIFKVPYGTGNNITISGLTLDANGVGGAIHVAVDGANAIPANTILILNNTFRNTLANPAGPWDGAIYDPVGLINSQIVGNAVTNCGTGIYVTNGNNLVISDNTFQTVHYGDAISLVFSAAPFAYGQGLQVLRNTGQHLGRMAIELWPNGTTQSSTVQSAVISDNAFTDWDSGFDPDPFGISIVAGQQMIVQDNKLIGGVAGFGIEVGAPLSSITQNTIQGFPVGIVLHDSHGTVVNGNLLSQQTIAGIELSNAPGSRANLSIINNRILSPKSVGIFVDVNDWGGSSITNNSIWRQAGTYPDDATGTFTGIGITPPNSPVTVTGNAITQSAAIVPGGFTFIGIRINGDAGSNANSSYQKNAVLSLSPAGQTIGLFGNTAGSLNGAILQNNSFQGLFAASGGAGSTLQSNSGNLVYNCTQLGPIPLN
ncbi:MAG TPA: right-handed parallel beta-helix repeat-containing protein [Bryobacteraceae bacterium]|nr:right-handed parallel beta-helix repeat-containing protein [Bryobacteraceae bacterium]